MVEPGCDLLLHDQHIAGREACERALGILDRHLGIRAGKNADDVLAGLVDEDHRDALRDIEPLHVAQIDAAFAQQRQRLVAHRIPARGADHLDRRAGTARRQRLVGALAAGGRREARPGNCLARLRDAAHLADEIEVDRAEDDNHAMALRMVFQLRMVATIPLGTLLSTASWLRPR